MDLDLKIEGGRSDGLAERARLEKLGARYLPPEPRKLIKPVLISLPAKLEARFSTEDRVQFLAEAYRSVALRCGTQSRFMQLREIEKHRSFKLLSSASNLLLDRDISPLLWVLWSRNAWEAFVEGSKYPTPAFVFSERRIIEHHDWFEREREGLLSERVEYPVRMKRLFMIWDGMWQCLMGARPDNRPELMRIVDGFFPGDQFERLVRQCNEEARVQQRQVDQEIARGGYWW